MRLRIDVEDASGNKIGAGPITSATSWRNIPRLDKIGEFAFSMPASDPRAAYLQVHRHARCWMLVDGAKTEIGLGIIEDIQYTGDAGATMIQVSGPDILRELVWRSEPWTDPLPGMLNQVVGQFFIAEAGYASPTKIFGLHVSKTTGQMTDCSGSVTTDPNQASYAEWPAAIDGNAATSVSLTNPYGGFDSFHWLYVCYPTPYSAIKFQFATPCAVTGAKWDQIQYYSIDPVTGVGGWKNFPAYVDNTNNGSGTWHQDGTVGWLNGGGSINEIPTDWAPLEQQVSYGGGANASCPSAATYTQFGPLTGYWVRFQGDDVDPPGATISEITVETRLPTLNGPSQALAVLNPTWTLDTVNGFSTTLQKTLLLLQDQNVFVTLTKLAQVVNEHFRLGSPSTARQVVWLRRNTPASGVRAVRVPTNGVGIEINPNVCAITKLTYKDTSANLATRVIPYGAGSGTVRLNLAKTTRGTDGVNPLPAGYTLDTTNNQIVNSTAEGTYGRIDAIKSWPEIAAASTATSDVVNAANALYDLALWWLTFNSAPQTVYALDVVGLQQAILPGETIRVIWREIVDGYTVLDINDDLIVLEATHEITQDGYRTVGLVVSSIPVWPQTESEVIAAAIQRQFDATAFPQRIALEQMYSPGTSGGYVVSTGGGGVYAR